ncbi:hypothetical protein NDU88_011823 [Pleurodeles waltl]|uniref:Uncharacterized protein n=1 Tax=Pleurodeles waltl TaxID=8319 RepID=A0AAV7S7Z8_PLEWA|nr:hypothetical protein NDU88_011823 [Pleurodeles waltl]
MRRIQEAGPKQEEVLQRRAEEEDSGERSTAGRSTTETGTEGGFQMQEHSREEYYRQGHRRRIQEAGALHGGVLQTRAQEEDSGGRSTPGREYYRQGHMRRIQEAGAQQEGVLQTGNRRRTQEAGELQGGVLKTRAQEKDSGGRSTAGGSTRD